MAGERTFVVKFISDILGATKGIKKVGDDLGTLGKQVDTGFGQKFKSVMPSFKQFAVAGTAAFAAAGAGAYKAIQAASDLAESQSKVGVVFGDSAKQVEDFAQTSATSLGITKQAALEATGTYGNLFQAFGVGQGEAATMSTTLVGLAADLASFNNTTVDDAILALRSGLSGETEPLKKYGIAINDVRLKEEARNMGLYKGTGALSVTAKTQAAYALILKDSTLAQGDFERTSGGLANQQRILKAQLSDVGAQIGTVMIPAFLGAVSFINDSMLPAFRDFGTALQEGGLSGGFDFIATRFKESAPKVLSALGDLIMQAVQWIGTSGLPMLYAGVNQLADSLTGWIEPRIPGFINSLTKFLMAGYKWIYTKGLPQLLDAVQSLGDTLASFVGKAARQLPAQLVNMLATIGKWILSDGIPAVLGMGARLAGSLIKWTATIGGQLIIGLGGAIVALVAALPDLFVGFVKGIGNIAVGAVKWFISKFDDMKTGLANIAVSVVNTLIDVFNKIPLIPNIPKITLDTKKMGTQIGLTSEQLQTVNEKFDKVNGTLKVSSEDMKEFAGSTSTAGAATAKAGKAIDENKKKLDQYNDSLKKSTNLEERRDKARKSEKKSFDSLTQANDNLASAKAKLSQIERGFGAGSPEAIAAQREVDRAQRDQERATMSVEEAIYSVADAEKNLADVRKDPESSPMDIRRAELNLADAKLSVKDSIDAQIDSTKELNDQQTLLNETVSGATIGSELYDEALKNLQDATLDQVSAFENWEDQVKETKSAQDEFNASLQATADLIAKYPKVLGGMTNPMAGVSSQVSTTAGGGFVLRPNDTYQININAAIAEGGLPQKVVEALQQYNRSIGKIPVTTN
jgi:hypothetical protein